MDEQASETQNVGNPTEGDNNSKENENGEVTPAETLEQQNADNNHSDEAGDRQQNGESESSQNAKENEFDEADPEETLQRLTDDIKRLDEQENDAKISSRYDKNRFIFLIQSTLLGISYSIIWPTLWLYVQDFNMSSALTKFAYGMTFAAYPIASIASAVIVEHATLSTKTIIILLGVAEIVGNLVFSLNFHPSLLFIGRFIAGLGDAFYVILMRDMKSKHGYTKNEGMTMECLAAFIFGVILSPGINLLTTLIPFKLLSWQVNAHNYPGLTTSILFILMELVVIIFLPAQMERESSMSVSRSPSSTGSSKAVFRDWGYKGVFVGIYSFLYTYIVSYFEISLPMIIYEKLHLNSVGAMLLYAVLGTLYAMILMFAMTVNLTNQLEASIGITVLAKTAGMFGVLYLGYSDKGWVDAICVGAIVVCLAILWSNDDMLFINLVRTVVPISHREFLHNLRKNISKLSFGIAAVSVPFLFQQSINLVAVPILVALVYFCFCGFVVIRFADYKANNYKQLK